MRSASTMLQCTIAVIMLLPTDGRGQEAVTAEQLKVGETAVSAILERLGAKLESGLTARQRADYSRVFRLVDRDRDLRHSKEEYIEKGNYLNPQARRGIFRAADENQDGFVSKAEYVLNRIITDEAKAIEMEHEERRVLAALGFDDPYVVEGDPSSGLLPGIHSGEPGEEGAGDKRIQAYCFRLCMTDAPENRVPLNTDLANAPIVRSAPARLAFEKSAPAT